ncbi:hypothetical protein Tco_1097425 [Tanacetum coccineum]
MKPRCRYNPCNFSDDSVVSVARHKLDCLGILWGTGEQETRSVRELLQQINEPTYPIVEVPQPKPVLPDPLVIMSSSSSSSLDDDMSPPGRSRVAPPQPILPLNTASRSFRQAARSFRAT